jgi:hypothetical protein
MRMLLASIALLIAQTSAADEWRSLFDGHSLAGWKANVDPEAWSVADGAIRAHAVKTASHLFYVGEHADGVEAFKDFELEAVVRGEPGANSGIFVHTDMAVRNDQNLLANGYEIQLNSSEIEKRKTGSLYAVVDLDKSPVDETQWFTLYVRIDGKRIVVRVNDQTVVDYTEPDDVVRPPERAGRKLNPKGAGIALQAHDPKSTFYFKSIRVRPLP